MLEYNRERGPKRVREHGVLTFGGTENRECHRRGGALAAKLPVAAGRQ
jgi:hypothetical protein